MAGKLCRRPLSPEGNFFIDGSGSIDSLPGILKPRGAEPRGDAVNDTIDPNAVISTQIPLETAFVSYSVLSRIQAFHLISTHAMPSTR